MPTSTPLHQTHTHPAMNSSRILRLKTLKSTETTLTTSHPRNTIRLVHLKPVDRRLHLRTYIAYTTPVCILPHRERNQSRGITNGYKTPVRAIGRWRHYHAKLEAWSAQYWQHEMKRITELADTNQFETHGLYKFIVYFLVKNTLLKRVCTRLRFPS